MTAQTSRPSPAAARAAALALGCALVLSGLLWSAPPKAAADASSGKSWLALGDSYSSGEGQGGTTRDKGYGNQDCARATGKIDGADGPDSDALAWPAIAYNQVSKDTHFTSLDFVACTGNITDDWQAQMSEAIRDSKAEHRNSWDVISMTFGGNNVNFSKIIEGCLGLPTALTWSDFDPTQGCDIQPEVLAKRIDALAAAKPVKGAGYQFTLPMLYDGVARHVNPGGQVVVAGYPLLVEDAAKRPLWARHVPCAGILPQDTPLLRLAGERLNTRIRDAVAAADKRWAPSGVRFTYADLANGVYETSAGRHATCTGEPWLNGPSSGVTAGDVQLERSFHPNRVGHAHIGPFVADIVQHHLDDPTLPAPRNDSYNKLHWTVRVQTGQRARLGPLELGMRGEDAVPLGVAKPDDRTDCKTPFTDAGLLARESDSEHDDTSTFWNRDGRLNAVFVRTSDWPTGDGIRVGDSMAKVKRVYGSRAVAGRDPLESMLIYQVRGADNTYVEFATGKEWEPDSPPRDSYPIAFIVLGIGTPSVSDIDGC